MNFSSWRDRFLFGFETFVLGRDRPYLLGLVITDRCNLDCHYCETRNAGKIHFTWEKAVRLLEDSYRRGHRSLYFTGGEPLTWSDSGRSLANLAVRARKIGFHEIFIFTNGTFPLEAPGASFIVSLDGPRRIHESIRPGTYDAILDHVRRASTRAIFASITLGRANAPHLEEFAEDVVRLGLFRGISFNLLTHWPEMVARHGIPVEDRPALLDRIWALKERGYPIVLSRAAWRALRANDWKRPIKAIELATPERVFTCCRDVDHPEICATCGYANCVEVAQMLALKPSALAQVFRMVE